MTKKELALEYHKKGYNCAQAVACAFCEELGVSETEMYKIAEGFGLGMGMMDTCGALTGLFMLIGLKNSGGTEQAGIVYGDKGLTKRRKSTLQSSRRLMDLFIVKN